MTEFSELKRQYERIRQEIENTARKRAQSIGHLVPVTLLAVSKGQSSDAIRALYQLGHRDFGENYVQELLQKASILLDEGCVDIRWHFIGHLQSNKVKVLVPVVSALHTVDSGKLAQALAIKWEQAGREKPLPVFIEVNMDEELAKSGVAPNQVLSLAQNISQLPQLALQGLMAIPNPEKDPRASFESLRRLEESIGSLSSRQLSMGMSSDYAVAVEEGSTYVRVGTSLFGARGKN